MPLVINALGGEHTDTHTHTDVQTKAISRNQVRAAKAPGLKISAFQENEIISKNRWQKGH